MSRVAKAPITVPKGVMVEIAGQSVKVQGTKGSLEWTVHPTVSVQLEDGIISVSPAAGQPQGWAMAGTTRAVLNNMVVGCGIGFSRKLTLVGVGYRAQAKGDVLNLSLGFSHPVDYPVPGGIKIETPSQTEIIVSGADRQRVGQVAAEIRAYRPPEPYKGKGVRYADEDVLRKEAKKK
ncbi:MAG: 50S ribosomal protein L6 [Lamprocystis purpurea]|jgi:large subunit ribosomal protein L6|uniref:50S ribosomal protein L6 n=1 Tax=Lamprocystis purpurea TaxID=61598 RepID=UPI0003A4972E|nr:50S ribosomal protein L6 [Lamprocystis purpurea]MBV5272151.1 50S ribosomal protein L6 [Lamprocystis purpurea]